MKIGMTFTGQGAQYPGMGKDLYEHYTAAKKVFDLAGEQIKDWCFNGDEDTLKQTNVTQPCVYTVTMAAYEAFLQALSESGLSDKVVTGRFAGFSLGEYSALTAVGTIDDIRKGIDIVTKRGIWMQEAGLDQDGVRLGGMIAARGSGDIVADIVEEAREDGVLEVANYNSPTQTVVGGDKNALKRFRQTAKKYKMKTTPLPISIAAHSPMMASAAEKMQRILEAADLKMPQQTVYTNATADDMMKNYNGGDMGAYLAGILAQQLIKPVFWEDTVRHFKADGMEAFIEVGPGDVLTGLAGNICPDIPAFHVENVETLEYTIEHLNDML